MRKKSFPRFEGQKLDYYTFKETWLEEVSVERQHPKRVLASLKAALCQPAQHKVVDCETLKEVWEVLDKQYGDLRELRAALKFKISQIKLKAHTGSNKLLELFNEVQYLTVKVKAHGGENSLKYDEEYIALLLKHLTEEQKLKWVDLEDNSWDSFYTFLEKLAIQARKLVSIDDTLKAIGAQGSDSKSTGDKKTCNTCGKVHSGYCNKNKVVAAAELKKPVGKQNAGGHQNKAMSSKLGNCLICKEPQHIYKDKTGQDEANKALYACPRWNKADSLMKKKIIEEIQEVESICKICSYIGHLSGNCWHKNNYVCENSQCGKVHIKYMCEFQP